MAVKQILIYPNDKLSKACESVEEGEDVSSVVENLLDTMEAYKAEGVAANQIGVNKRIFVFKDHHGVPVVFVNPVIEHKSDVTMTAVEGCLSFPGVSLRITRSSAVTIQAQDEHGRTVIHSLKDTPAVAVQHELDHLDGVVMLDHVEGRLERRRALKRLKKVRKKHGI